MPARYTFDPVGLSMHKLGVLTKAGEEEAKYATLSAVYTNLRGGLHFF